MSTFTCEYFKYQFAGCTTRWMHDWYESHTETTAGKWNGAMNPFIIIYICNVTTLTSQMFPVEKSWPAHEILLKSIHGKFN